VILSSFILLFQDAPATEGNGQTIVRIVAGALAVILVAIVILRRKRSGKKEEEDEF
jgi:hypothetical protein